jgi:hypothetical protein
MPGEEACQAARACPDAAFRELGAQFPQEGERVFFVDPKDQSGLCFQALRVAVAAHGLGRHLPVLPETLMPTDRAGRSDPEAFGRLTPRDAPASIAATTRAQIDRQG